MHNSDDFSFLNAVEVSYYSYDQAVNPIVELTCCSELGCLLCKIDTCAPCISAYLKLVIGYCSI